MAFRLRLPSPIRFRPPREREEEKETVAERLRAIPTAPKRQADQLQTDALAARLANILSGQGEDETKLDMQSELLLRRMAVLLRKQAPKVGPAQ